MITGLSRATVMPLRAVSFFLVLFATLLLAEAARANAKMALVIGNSSYESVADLKNPANDARDIAQVLEGIGFTVDLRLDLSQLELLRAFQEFQRAASNSEVAIVYYAGHGIEIDKQNYLIPISASLKTDRDVVFEAVPLETALLAVEGAKKVSLVIVDACRDNPFAASMVKTSATRSIGRGLAVIEPQGNTLVAYAAREGTTASDGSGRNSPYAEALIEVLSEPGVEIGKLFRRVRDQVMANTNNQQEPFTYGSLSAEDLFLNPPAPTPAAFPVASAPAAVAPAAPAPSQPEFPQSRRSDPTLDGIFWSTVKDSTDPRDIEDYLQAFPDGVFRPLAERRLEQLLQAAEAPPPSVVAPPAEAEPSEPAPAVAATSPLPVEEAPQTQIAALPQTTAPAPAPSESSRLVIVEPQQPRVQAPAPAAPETDVVASAGTAASGLRVVPPVAETPPAVAPTALRPAPPTEPFVLNREKTRTIQRQLNALGYNTGRPDGVTGRRTRAGMNEFLASLGLPPKQGIDAELDGIINAAISMDRVELFEERVSRFKPNRRLAAAGVHGVYCLMNADGSVSDGLEGRPLVCKFVRPRTSRTVEVASYFDFLRNAKGSKVFPMFSRAQVVDSNRFTDETSGDEIVISNGTMSFNGSIYVYSAFPE